jgi:hypothetical protein
MDTMTTHSETSRYVVCLGNRGYAASLVTRRLYRVIEDPAAARRGLVRVVDESGEDYLYPKRLFAAIELPMTVTRRLAATLKPTP